MNYRLDPEKYSASDLEDKNGQAVSQYRTKIQRNGNNKSERVRDIEDRAKISNVKIIGIQKKRKEWFGENNQLHFGEKKFPWPK